MHACSAQPVLRRASSHCSSQTFLPLYAHRRLHPSRCLLNSPPQQTMLPHRRGATETVQRGSQAASEVQELSRAALRSEQSGTLDLRSLGTRSITPGKRAPALRSRSSYPPSAGTKSSGPPTSRRRRFNQVNDLPLATSEPSPEDLYPDEQFPGEESETDKRSQREQEEAREEAQRNYMEEFNRPKPWTPDAVTIDNLRPYLPRFPFGGEGSAKGLGDRLHNVTDSPDIDEWSRSDDLAERLKGGHYVQFRSQEEKELVMKKLPKKTFTPLSEPSRKILEGEVVEGKYQSYMETTRHPTLDKMIHSIRQNGSYTKDDEISMLKKLTQLLPVATPSASTKAAVIPQSVQLKRRARKES